MKLTNYLWILPFFSFLAGYACLAYFFHTENIETPSLVGKSIQQAATILSEKNLNLRIMAHKEDADLPDSTILSQSPAPHQNIKPQQSIFLVVSEKPPVPIAQNLRGKSLDEIKELFKGTGIHIKTYSLPSIYPVNTCIAQWPEPNSPLEKKSVIIYLASDDTKPILWPDFIGKPITLVTEFLSNHQITPEIIYSARSTSHSPESTVVIDQRPLAGSLIKRSALGSLHVQLQVK